MSRVLGSLLLLLWATFFSPEFGAVDRPSLVLIIVDSVGSDSVGIYGSTVPGIKFRYIQEGYIVRSSIQGRSHSHGKVLEQAVLFVAHYG